MRRELESVAAEYRKPKTSLPIETFLERISECGLMDSSEIRSFLNRFPEPARPQTGEDLARELFRNGKLTKFQAQAIYQGKTRGLVMGNYVVLDQIGKGGMGQVYKAQHRRMERIVALKVLPGQADRSEDSSSGSSGR